MGLQGEKGCWVRMSSFDFSFEAWDFAEWEKEARPEWNDVKGHYEV